MPKPESWPLVTLSLSNGITRIFSDVHYGDRASRVQTLSQLTPLLDGADRIVLNGDSVDTRHGPYPQRTADLRAETLDFFARRHPATVLLTGNHDPEISALHTLELGAARVFVTHGDVIFDDIVPWGRDAPAIRAHLAAAHEAAPHLDYTVLETRLSLFRKVCAALPQRHQAESDRWKYFLSFAADTFWPPLRVTQVLRAWYEAPRRAAALLRTHRPAARFVVLGHVHRPGIWRSPHGSIIINTGSFCPPLGASVVDLGPERLTVRSVEFRRGAFHAGAVQAEFALADP